jgi:outer membrane protein
MPDREIMNVVILFVKIIGGIKMKKIIVSVFAFFAVCAMLQAQKFAYVDSQYILDNLPEFTEAQVQLDEISTQWQTEIEGKFNEVDKMRQDFQAQAVLLPEDMKKKKEQDILDKEKEAKNLQRQRFGKDGDLMKKRQELVKPIQEKVYNAIQEISSSNNYAVIFDKAGALTIMYANPKYDISDDVLDNLGAAQSGRKGKNQPAGGNTPTPPSGTKEQPGGIKPPQGQGTPPQDAGSDEKPARPGKK